MEGTIHIEKFKMIGQERLKELLLPYFLDVLAPKERRDKVGRRCITGAIHPLNNKSLETYNVLGSFIPLKNKRFEVGLFARLKTYKNKVALETQINTGV